MRSTSERLLHAAIFEILGILLIVPAGAIGLGVDMQRIGILAIALTTLAALWNYAFNIGFDRALLRWRGSARKTLWLRVLHALLFEGALVALSVPLVAAALGVGLVEALLMDLGLALFYLCYAFGFNLAWDRVFPPAPAT